MKKFLAMLLTLMLMLGTLAACGGGGGGETAEGGDDAAAAEGLQVGIVLPTKDEPRWLQDEASFTSALESAGFTSEVMFSQGSTASGVTAASAINKAVA